MNRIINIISNISYGNRVVAVIRVLTGILFLYSGYFKALDPVNFSRITAQYGMLPDILLPYVSIIIPFLELTLGLFLLIGFRIKASSIITAFLLFIFTIAITVNFIQGKAFDCGCFELGIFGISEIISAGLIIRDILLILILIVIFNAKRHFYSVDNLVEKERLRDI